MKTFRNLIRDVEYSWVVVFVSNLLTCSSLWVQKDLRLIWTRFVEQILIFFFNSIYRWDSTTSGDNWFQTDSKLGDGFVTVWHSSAYSDTSSFFESIQFIILDPKCYRNTSFFTIRVITISVTISWKAVNKFRDGFV